MRGWVTFPLFSGLWITLPVRLRTLLAVFAVIALAVFAFVLIGAGFLIATDNTVTSFAPVGPQRTCATCQSWGQR